MERFGWFNMTSNKLRMIFLLSIPFFIIHGIEEYITGFYKVDVLLFGHLSPNISQPAFILFQILWWILLIIIFKLTKTKRNFNLMIIVGFIYIFELHHLIHTFFIEKAYYLGTITALVFPFFTFFFWKEFLRTRRSYGRS